MKVKQPLGICFKTQASILNIFATTIKFLATVFGMLDIECTKVFSFLNVYCFTSKLTTDFIIFVPAYYRVKNCNPVMKHAVTAPVHTRVNCSNDCFILRANMYMFYKKVLFDPVLTLY